MVSNMAFSGVFVVIGAQWQQPFFFLLWLQAPLPPTFCPELPQTRDLVNKSSVRYHWAKGAGNKNLAFWLNIYYLQVHAM